MVHNVCRTLFNNNSISQYKLLCGRVGAWLKDKWSPSYNSVKDKLYSLYLYSYLVNSYSEDVSSIADHSSSPKDLSLRITNDGYVTGDFQMDMPPMKAVLIDPYSG